jgi:hypothetical protein
MINWDSVSEQTAETYLLCLLLQLFRVPIEEKTVENIDR